MLARMKERCDTTGRCEPRVEERSGGDDGRPIVLFLSFDFVHFVPLVPETKLQSDQTTVGGWPACIAAKRRPARQRQTPLSACARERGLTIDLIVKRAAWDDTDGILAGNREGSRVSPRRLEVSPWAPNSPRFGSVPGCVSNRGFLFLFISCLFHSFPSFFRSGADLRVLPEQESSLPVGSCYHNCTVCTPTDPPVDQLLRHRPLHYQKKNHFSIKIISWLCSSGQKIKRKPARAGNHPPPPLSPEINSPGGRTRFPMEASKCRAD